MKKLFIISFMLMLALPSILFADEIELGLSLTPMEVLKSEEDQSMETLSEGEGGGGDFILGLHFGYSMAWLLYASIDANAMPPWWVAKTTSTVDELTGERVAGTYQPGFVTFLDVGIRPTIGSFILLAELGINHFYIKGGGDNANKLGVNFRFGLGYKLDPFSISLIATSIFPDFKTMSYVFDALSDDEEWAQEALAKSIIPSLTFYIHL